MYIFSHYSIQIVPKFKEKTLKLKTAAHSIGYLAYFEPDLNYNYCRSLVSNNIKCNQHIKAHSELEANLLDERVETRFNDVSVSLSIGLFLLVSIVKDGLQVESLVLSVSDLSDPNEEVLKARLSSISFKYLSILVCDLSSLNFDFVFEECSVF